jgi:hypothetical protein
MSAVRPVRFLCTLIALVAGSAQAFEYAGLDRQVDPMLLRQMFPYSHHEFWERGSGSVVLPDEEPEEFEALLDEGDGRYVVRLAPDDTRAEVTSVSLTLEVGKVLRMTLGFEREGQGIRPEAIEKRFPPCRNVLDALIARYGEPVDFATRLEDNLEHRIRTWAGIDGVMRLDCGRFTGRKPIFAMDLEFERASADALPPAKPKARPATRPAAKPERKK